MKKLLACNDDIATLNFKRYADMDLYRNLTPAILSYDGIQYKYMAPQVFEDSYFDYIEKHLRILSGFYGSVYVKMARGEMVKFMAENNIQNFNRLGFYTRIMMYGRKRKCTVKYQWELYAQHIL